MPKGMRSKSGPRKASPSKNYGSSRAGMPGKKASGMPGKKPKKMKMKGTFSSNPSF